MPIHNLSYRGDNHVLSRELGNSVQDVRCYFSRLPVEKSQKLPDGYITIATTGPVDPVEHAAH